MYKTSTFHIIKRWAVMLMCIAFLLSLFGCSRTPVGTDDPITEETTEYPWETILDGPGMIAPKPWHTMELSRSDMYYPYNFYFKITLDGGRYLATGHCADEEGNSYETGTGIEIPLEVIDVFDLGSLSDKGKNSSMGDYFVLDAPTISLTLTYADNSQKNKEIADSLSIQLYQTLLPYFANQKQ